MTDYLGKFSLQGKIAFVCGGVGLIGSEVSQALAQAGAQTIILDIDGRKGRRLEGQIRRQGHRVYYEYFNLIDLKNLEDALKAFVKKYKTIDVWVNAAYPRTPDWEKSLEELRVDSLRKNVDMHLNSFAWTSRLIALIMRQEKTKGSIINFGSIYGVQANDFTIYERTDMTSPMMYSLIKGGIVNVTRYLASYFGEYGIRLNTICPGGVFNHQNKRFVKNYEKKVPLKRMARPEEVASAVLFLATEASSYVTGCTLMVDGGWTIV